jgi:hypothetical protein
MHVNIQEKILIFVENYPILFYKCPPICIMKIKTSVLSECFNLTIFCVFIDMDSKERIFQEISLYRTPQSYLNL